MATDAKRPPMKSSNEANEEQLAMAREQGQAYVRALHHMANEEADNGGEQRAGDYIVAYAIEHAEGMYRMKNGQLEWEEPTDENVHIEIAVRDAADNRFIPGLNVQLTLLDAEGQRIGSHHQPFLWHPWLWHYGRNWHLPGDGQYTLRVHIDPPDFGRHDKNNGHRFADPVDVTFENVAVKTGQKRS